MWDTGAQVAVCGRGHGGPGEVVGGGGEWGGGLLDGGGGGLGPKNLCAKNGPTRFSQQEISFFPTMVTFLQGTAIPILPLGGGGGIKALPVGILGVCVCSPFEEGVLPAWLGGVGGSPIGWTDRGEGGRFTNCEGWRARSYCDDVPILELPRPAAS